MNWAIDRKYSGAVYENSRTTYLGSNLDAIPFTYTHKKQTETSLKQNCITKMQEAH